MKKSILVATFILMGLGSSFAQNYNNWAIGVKVGEPIGINVRKYFDSGNKNFDINFGTYGLLWGQTRKYQGGYYYENTSGMMIQGIFHWNKQLGTAERFQVYYGFGGQINSRKRPLVAGNNVASRELALGGVVDGGIEYSLPNSNMGIFLDAGLYIELLKKPMFLALPASVGLRVNIGN